jgi:hypothetical protein
MSVKNWWPLAWPGVTRVAAVQAVPSSERMKYTWPCEPVPSSTVPYVVPVGVSVPGTVAL